MGFTTETLSSTARMGDEMEKQNDATVFWLGYNVGYLCFMPTFVDAKRLSEELFYMLENMRRLGLDSSDVFSEAMGLASKIGSISGQLPGDLASEVSSLAFSWRSKIAGVVGNKGAFWLGYNVVYISTQLRRTAAGILLRELHFLTENLKASGLASGSLLEDIARVQRKIQQVGGNSLLDEEMARMLEEACSRWKAEILRRLQV
jgi:hypothetical protein